MKYLLLAILLTCLYTDADAQSDSARMQHFNANQQQQLQEKIYIHTSKPFHVAGELLWFKLYCVDASVHNPLSSSSIAYIELLDAAQQPVTQLKIALHQGNGSGTILLPATLSTGQYTLKAYTKWMRNFNSTFFAEKQLTIVNTMQPVTVPVPVQDTIADIQCFPEGGQLIQQLASKVGIRIRNNLGQGIPATGAILNRSGDTVARFQTRQDGLAHFQLTPLPNEHYKIRVRYKGHTRTQNLPQAATKGYALKLEEDGNTILLLAQTPGMPAENIHLLAHTRQQAFLSMSNQPEKEQLLFMINKEQLPEGITVFTLLNKQQQPVSERLYFKSPQPSLQIVPTLSNNTFSKRQTGTVSLLTKDNQQQAVSANLSMAIYRIDELQQTDSLDINTYLLLNADLGNKIERPWRYIGYDTATVRAADDLMLTQHWKRFDWQQINASSLPVLKYPPELSGQLISGIVTDKLDQTPQAGKKVYLSIPGRKVSMYTTITNKNGAFLFELPNAYGNGTMILQIPDTLRQYLIHTDPPFVQTDSSQPFSPIAYRPAAPSSSLQLHHVAMQVMNAYTDTALTLFDTPPDDSSAFFGTPDEKIYLDRFTRFPTMEEVFKEFIHSVIVRRKHNGLHLHALNRQIDKYFDTDPLVLLDGLPIFDHKKLFNYDPLKVERVDVIARRYFYGPAAYDGIISLTTYKGNLDGYPLDKEAIVQDYTGLQPQRHFYSPDHRPGNDDPHLPDYRQLLSWQPDINTDDDGYANITFTTSDIPGKYVLVIQGITEQGQAGYQLMYFDVKDR